MFNLFDDDLDILNTKTVLLIVVCLISDDH